MINFRYHVVSLTSVFLALAIGLVLGTAALNGPVVDNLNDQLSGLRKSNSQYRDRVDELEGAAKSRGAFVEQVASSTMAGTLTGKSVLVVQAQGPGPEDREGVVKMLQDGGATITGDVRLTNDFTDPKRDEALHDLSSQHVPAGVDMPNSGEGVDTASALLASVLLKGVDVSEEDRNTVLQSFAGAGFVVVEGRIEAQADAVVFLLGPAATDSNAGARNKAIVKTAQQFDRVCQFAVAAAPLAGDDGDPLVEMRNDGNLSKTLSTVDGVSTPEGRLATAMAVVEQFAGNAGAYGSGQGAKARVPQIS